MWTLIIMLATGYPSASAAIATVPGFSSEQTCKDAAARVKRYSGGPDVVCMEVK